MTEEEIRVAIREALVNFGYSLVDRPSNSSRENLEKCLNQILDIFHHASNKPGISTNAYLALIAQYLKEIAKLGINVRVAR